MRILATAALLCAALAPASFANQFHSLFRESSHDFGTVARAAKTEHRFEFENPYNQPIHVRSVRTSCGCTTPIIETETVPAGGRGSILAKFNTGTHSGARAATVTVTFDRPSFGEVQLHVKGYIRTDVVFQPGEASFGSVTQGEAKDLEIVVDYAGKPNWKIVDVRCDESCIQIEPEEKSRQNGRIQYAMKIRLSDNAPTGPMESEIVLHTNDRNLTTVPLRLTANVLADLSASPNLLSLGDISASDSLKHVIVIKGQQPFRILNVSSDAFDVQANGIASEEAKTLHTLPIVLEPRTTPSTGDSKAQIVIETDHPAKPKISIDVIYRLKTPTATPTSYRAWPHNPLRDVTVANQGAISDVYDGE